MRKLTVGGLVAVITLVMLAGSVSWSPVQPQVVEANAGTQWTAAYFNNASLSGSPVLTRVDDAINFNWATGSPDPSVPADNFSARWTATVNFPTTGKWVFRVGADDGVRMWIDVTPIVDEWHGNPEGYRTYQVDINGLTAGDHVLKVEYFESTGNAGIQVQWWMEGAATTVTGGETASPPPPPPPATVYAAPITRNVNVRSGPGQGNSVMARINYPRSYLVVGGVPDLSWLLIDLTDGRQGWVSNDWVWLYALEPEKNEDTTEGGQPDFVDDIPRIYEPIAPPSDLPPVGERVVLHGQATDTLNLRDGPSLYASKIIGAIPQGASFTVEARSRNAAWYLVNYRDVRGWVSALYVNLVDGYATDLLASSEVVPVPPMGEVFVPQTETGEPITVRGRLTATLKLRDAASLRGNELGEVPSGTELVIEGRNTNGAWFLVTYDGQQGWIYSPKVAIIEGAIADLPIR